MCGLFIPALLVTDWNNPPGFSHVASLLAGSPGHLTQLFFSDGPVLVAAATIEEPLNIRASVLLLSAAGASLTQLFLATGVVFLSTITYFSLY